MKLSRLGIPALCLATGLLAAGAYAVAAEVTAPAAAPTAHSHWGHHRGASFMHVLRKLNLTPEQKTQVHAIFAQAKPQLDAMRGSARDNHTALTAAAPTDAKYPELIANEQTNAIARIQKMSDLKTQVYAVLTPAQQAQIPGLLAAERAAHESRAAAWRASHQQG
jgi:periplasmic protein CpxP/Spy